MSLLTLAQDSHLMMLELAIDNLHVPWTSRFDAAIMKKTQVMFRWLDNDWTIASPQRRDYKTYRGSNLEDESFNGGVSVVFAMPFTALRESASNVNLQLYVYKKVSEYFEMDPCQNVGFALVKVDKLFNGIVKELREREELACHLSDCYAREPISRSCKGTFPLLNDNPYDGDATIRLYVRISYLGKCVMTEIDVPNEPSEGFYARKEDSEMRPYLCRELTREELEAGGWASLELPAPVPSDALICRCPRNEPFDKIDAATCCDRKPRKRKSAKKEKLGRALEKIARENRRILHS